MTQKEKYWLKQVKKCEQSGLGQTEFCRVNQIHPSSFSSNKTKLRRKGFLDNSGPQDLFIPIKAKDFEKKSSITISLLNGQEISFASPPPIDWFITLIDELGKENVKH